MAVTKAGILAFVNKKLNLVPALAGTALDISIQEVADELSEEKFLEKVDTSQNLTSSSVFLTDPSDMIDDGLISIVLNDGSVDLAPLLPLKGGYEEYLNNRSGSNNNLSGSPTYYARRLGKIYLLSPPGKAYTTTITYFKFHAVVGATLEFSDLFRNTIYNGVAMKEAADRRMEDRLAYHVAMYAQAKEKRRAKFPAKVHIVR